MSGFRVALLVETSKAFGRGILAGVGDYVRLQGRWTMYVEERGLDEAIPSWLTASEFDGILVRSMRQEVIERVRDIGLPLVALGEENPPGVVGVLNDDCACAQTAAQHLLDRGFENFGYVGLRGFVWSDARRDVFCDHLKQAGYRCDVLEASAEDIATSPWFHRREQLSDWVKRLPKPAGVMTCYDATARTLLDVCRSVGILVPEQIAIIGVDNDEVLCELSDPPLTSVAPDTRRIGREAAALLDRLMRGATEQVSSQVIPPRGVEERRSTGTGAVNDPVLAAVLGYIRRHACEGVGVAEVVRSVPLSRRTLERRFQRAMGHSLGDEIQRVKIERVKELLRDTPLKLDDIARLAGFNYTAYMVARFRDAEGMTPGQYRTQNRQQA